ncbi:MAG TPA: hypothetical protein VMT34_09535 [Aggregatilineales bacterium]|nr:hypothetical protein [Aggregatilineales bacterium]
MSNTSQPQGCLTVIGRLLIDWLGALFGFTRRRMQSAIEPLDQTYQEYVDGWVSERLAQWLHETRPEIDTTEAVQVLTGEADRYPEAAHRIRETLIDAKVTFSQRESKQYLEIESYMSPRQSNGKQPRILRWRAEREIAWQEIPDDIRERLIRLRQPVTLSYSIPQALR